jgi:hypothetical protein
MRTVTFGGQPYLVEIDWRGLDPSTSLSTEVRKIRQVKRQEAEKETKESQASGAYIAGSKGKKIKTFTHGIVMKYRHGLTLGIFPSNVKRTNIPSASAWLAKANQQYQANMGLTGNALTATSGAGSSPSNWIVIEKVDGLSIDGDSAYWFGVILDGLPYPSSDIVLSLTDTVDQISELLQSGKGTWTVFSNDPTIQSVIDDTSIQAQGINALVSDVKYDVKIKSLSGIPNWALPLFACILFLMLAYYGYTKWEAQRAINLAQKQSAENQRQMLAKQKAAQAAYIESVKQTVVNGLHDAANDINTTLKVASPDATINGWVDLMTKIPNGVPGWDLNGTQCGFTNSHPSCQVTITRKNGDDRMLRSAYPDAVITGDKATLTFNSDANISNNNIDGSQIVSGKFFNEEFVSDLQLFHNAGITSTVGAGQNIVKSITLPEKPNVVNLKAPKAFGGKSDKPETVTASVGVSTGTLTLGSGNFKSLQSLKDMVEALTIKGIVPTSVSINQGTWKLTATYFVRTASKPTIPTVKLDDGTLIEVSLPDEPWVHTLYSTQVSDMAQNSVAPSSMESLPQDNTGGQNATLNGVGGNRPPQGAMLQNPNMNRTMSNPLNLPTPQQ